MSMANVQPTLVRKSSCSGGGGGGGSFGGGGWFVIDPADLPLKTVVRPFFEAALFRMSALSLVLFLRPKKEYLLAGQR